MNVTYAFQVAATNGNGFSVFFRDPNFTTFRVTGNGTVTAGAVTIECCPGNMTGVSGSVTGTWTVLTTISVPANSTVDYEAGIVSGTFRARISTPVTGGTVAAGIPSRLKGRHGCKHRRRAMAMHFAPD
jgi:hypothetical protein